MRARTQLFPFVIAGSVGLTSASAEALNPTFTGTAGDTTSTVHPSGCFPMNNATGMTANDLHFTVYQKETNDVHVLGCKIQSDVFNQGTLTLSGHVPGEARPPAGMHSCDVTLSGANVPAGGTVNVCATFFLNKENVVDWDPLNWTVNGQPSGGGPPGSGFRIRRPRRGGSGGIPQSQQGNGVRPTDENPPNYQHTYCIQNPSAVAQQLTELKLLASMTEFSDPSAIDWTSIPAVQVDVDPGPGVTLEPPVLIPPNGEWCQLFDTTGSYVSGFIYLTFTLVPASSLVSSLSSLAAGQPAPSFGSHPVEAYCASPDCEAFPPPPTGCCQLGPSAIDLLTQLECNEAFPGQAPSWQQGVACPAVKVPSTSRAGTVAMAASLAGLGLLFARNRRRKAIGVG